MEVNGFEVDVFNKYKLPIDKPVSTCPKCSHERKKKNDKCLMIDWDRAIATCQHCGIKLQVHSYVRQNKPKKEYVIPSQKQEFPVGSGVLEWFRGRGIQEETVRSFRISDGKEWMPQVKKERGVIMFNYFLNNVLLNTKYRDGEKNFKLYKGAEKIFYNIDSIKDTDVAVIVEGEIDCLSYAQSGIDYVVSVPNGTTKGNVNLDFLDSSYEYFEDKRKIYIAVDNDEAGENLKSELIRRLGAERCYLVDFKNVKDANEYLIDYGEEALKDTINNATQCPLDNVLTYYDIRDKLNDFYLNGSPKGNQIGLPSFDEVFSINTSQYVVVTGIPSSGKSDFVDQMCVGYNLKYGWKTAYCSPENKPEHLHVDKIARKFAGFRPNTEQELGSVGWKKVEEHMEDNFFFINYNLGYNLTNVLKKAEELVKRKGIKVLVIDPFNKVPLKESKKKGINDYTNDYLQEIDDFCRRNDVFVILVAHPVKMKPENGKIPEPTFYDIKGGGEFYDMSYHGLLVHRDYDRSVVKIKVLKIKFQNLGMNGAECYFNWNGTNGRYQELDGFDGEDPMSVAVPIDDYSNKLIEKAKNLNQLEANYDFESETEDIF